MVVEGGQAPGGDDRDEGEVLVPGEGEELGVDIRVVVDHVGEVEQDGEVNMTNATRWSGGV